MAPKGHALLSYSACDRWMQCPASARLCEGLPDTAGAAAQEGTTAHALCEELLQELRDGPQGEYERADHPPEMQHAATAYRDFVRDTWRGMAADTQLFIEQEVSAADWVPESWGTCDCILIGGGELHIIDFKYGVGHRVSSVNNRQMRCYALGAYTLFKDTDDISKVSMTIVQPRISAEFETWTIPIDELLAWAENELKPAAKAAWDGTGPTNPGEEQCRWCKAYPRCRGYQDRYGALADFTELPAPAQLMTDDELGPWLQKIKGLAKYAEDLEAYALEQLKGGATIPGWKLVEGQSKRRFTDQEAAIKAAVQGGYSEALFYEKKPLALTAMEKVMGTAEFKKLCSAYTEKPKGAPKLAAADDKRPAFNPGEGFDVLA